MAFGTNTGAGCLFLFSEKKEKRKRKTQINTEVMQKLVDSSAQTKISTQPSSQHSQSQFYLLQSCAYMEKNSFCSFAKLETNR
jgi:hypothetical protein